MTQIRPLADSLPSTVKGCSERLLRNLTVSAGWTIVGKKDTCPVCMEKVDLRSIFSDRPWDTRNLNWNNMLDLVSTLSSTQWSPCLPLTIDNRTREQYAVILYLCHA